VRILVAGISGERQYVKSLRTFYDVIAQPGDQKMIYSIGRGDIARIKACAEFLDAKEYDALCLMDLDMLFPPDTLERLRSHDVSMVTGHYYARNTRNIHSICWEVGDGKWPFPPMVDVPQEGLHEIGCAGLGCVLIRREVLEAVAKHLPQGDNPFAIAPTPEITGDAGTIGSDFRFFSLARMLGYKLFLDATIDCRHGAVVWLGHEWADRMQTVEHRGERLKEISNIMLEENPMDKKTLEVRIRSLEERLEDYMNQRESALKTINILERQMIAIRAVIADEKFLLEKFDEHPQAEDGLFPTVPEEERQAVLDNRKKLPDISEDEAKEARRHVLQEEAKGFVDDIQSLRRA